MFDKRREESHSSQIYVKFLLQASSIARMAPITFAYKECCTPRKEEKLPIYSFLLPQKNACKCCKTRTPSSITISVDLHPIDMREFPNNLNRRGLFPTTCDIKKLSNKRNQQCHCEYYPLF